MQFLRRHLVVAIRAASGVGLLVVSVLLAVWLAFRASRDRSDSVAAMPQEQLGPTPVAPLETPRAAPASGAASDKPQRRTVRETMAEYWGAGWPELEARLRKEGVDLDRLLEPGDLLPWEEAEPLVHESFIGSAEMIQQSWKAAVDWPETVDAKFIEATFGVNVEQLTDADIAHVDQLGKEHGYEIRNTSEALWVGLQSALESRWGQNLYERSPLNLRGAAGERGRRVLVITSGAAGGWCVGATIYEDEFPEVVQLRSQLDQLKNERKKAIESYLASVK
jgi:hypothetical protein